MNSNEKFTVLIVDDNPHNVQVLAEIIEESGYECGLAMSGKQAFEFISIEKPDIILLDVMMPEMDGYELCRILKEDAATRDIPVIFLTAKSETDDIIKGFEAGGADYVAKPFNTVELKMRVKTHLELKKSRDEMQKYNEELKQINEQFHEANEIITMKNIQLKELLGKLEIASVTDSLTGLYNRRYMTNKIEEELLRYKRNKKCFSIVMADIDHFKKVNDMYGHDYGDFVLQKISQTLAGSVRNIDSVARWGGEEFLLLFPETVLDGALVSAERIRNKIKEQVIVFNKIKLSVTMTFGISAFKENENIDDMVKRADEALYKGKAKGRDCVVTG